MSVEWLLLSGVLVVALFMIARKLAAPGAGLVVLGALGGVSVAAAFWLGHLQQQRASRAQLIQKNPRENREGYVRSDTCQACHPAQYASWRHSFHRTMTQHATPESVRGNFDGTKLNLDGELYALERRGDEFWVELVDPDWKYLQGIRHTLAREKGAAPPPLDPNPPRVWKRVGMLTGSHHMQAYWIPSKYGNLQYSFPYTYLFEEERWVPRNDVFLLKPNAAHAQQIWNLTCLNCHATAAQSRQDPRSKLFDTRAGELGIACEACHGSGEEHIRRNSDPLRRYAQYRDGAPDPTIVNPARLDHVKSSEACGRCHAIRYTPNPVEWNIEGIRFHPGGELEGNAPLARREEYVGDSPELQRRRAMIEGSFWSDGLVRVSGREYNGMIASACFTRGQLSCVSCHSMHQYASNDDQLAPNMNGNAACLQCHTQFAARLEQHTHHPPNSPGSLCYNCHMPHTSYGLLKAMRSHTINSPSVAASVQTGRPNACNLCHLDRPLAWAQDHLAKWYGVPETNFVEEDSRISAAVLWLLRGDAGQRALIAWHMGWADRHPASAGDWLPPYLAETLTDTYAVVRYIGQRSLKRLAGFEHLSYDYIGPVAERARVREQVLGLWATRGRSNAPPRANVLLGPNGLLDRKEFDRILQTRNDRPMELHE